MLDELLLYWAGNADPWHRISCCDKPIFVFVEFCQVVGPKSLYHFPKDIPLHLDLDQIAFWVMSFQNIPASLTCTYNQQMGLYGLTLYSTILDLSARAFQRPFALVLLTNYRPNYVLIKKFQDKCILLMRPLLACNRSHFQYLMQHLLNFAENLKTKNFSNYYTFLSANVKFPSKINLIGSIQLIANRAKMWQNQISNGKNFFIVNHNLKCNCGADQVEFEKFLTLITAHCSSKILFSLLELAPCGGVNFFNAFDNVYNEIIVEEPSKALLFSNKTPILKSFFGADSQFFEDQLTEENNLKKRSSFKFISSSFANIIFHILTGDRIAVLASLSKEIVGINLIKQLNSLKICKQLEVAQWFTNIEDSFNYTNQFGGFLCSSDMSPKFKHKNFSIIIDLNFYRINCREYSGKFLNALQFLEVKNFPSEESLLTYLVSVFTDIQQYVIMTKYTSPRFLIDQLNLSASDKLILMKCLIELNVTKYSFLSTDMRALINIMPLKNMKL